MNAGRNNDFYRNGIVLLLFIAGVHLLYWRTIQAGFVTDFTGLQERLEGAPFKDFLNCFGFPAMHQVTNFFLYLFYKEFGTEGLPWYLIYSSLHAVNGFLGFLLAKRIFTAWSFSNPMLPVLTGSLLFFFSPYQAEAVVWKVCFNYLFCTSAMLASLWLLLKFLETKRLACLLWSHGFFLVGLFTFELALSLPLLAIVLTVWRSRGLVKLVLLPHLFFLAVYFLLNKIVLGAWVGHYGESVHLKFDLFTIGGNLLKYFTKYLLFWREWPHGLRESWMTFCDKPAVGLSFLVLCFFALGAWILHFRKTLPKQGFVWLFFVLFFLALLPVANLYVAWILQGENDRYGYLASLFFFMGVAALFQFLPKILRYAISFFLITLSIFFLYRMTVFWQNSTQVYYSLLKDFRWENASEVYVLAFPENYRGIPMFKDFSQEDLALKHALKFGAGKEAGGKFYQIAQFNMTAPTDGVTIQADSLNRLGVTFNQWGNWWWRNGIGTGGYETEKYKFTPEGNGAIVELKKPEKEAVFIYSVGGKWEDVKF